VTAQTPVLWQMRMSHFNEKARWALDYKGVAHVRRSVLPGAHVMRARRLYGGRTLPVLQVAGRTVADSTRIVEALEAMQPEPALYPADPAQRERALALEEFFDEELGPHIRRALFHDQLGDAAGSASAFTVGFPPAVRRTFRHGFPLLRPAMRRSMGIDAEAARRSRARTEAAMDRIEAELNGGEYMAGDGFSIADLTAAALMSPIVRPPQFAYPLPARWAPAVEEWRDSLRRRPAFAWVEEMYRRHRGASAAVNE
jgi:glutathione S-transferase